MSLRDDILSALQADAHLNTLLLGGIYAEAISRQDTPDAFDANSELQPCAVVTLETETPTGPYANAARLFFSVYFYGNVDDDARERVFALLHRQKIGTRVWTIEHADDVLNQTDPGLNVGMILSRYVATRLR